mgnify:CR=1 FL=1
MTKQKKLIVGAVVVVLAYYLYDRNKKMKAVSELKAGADVQPEVTEVPVGTGGIKSAPLSIVKSEKVELKELNFAGSGGKSVSAQYYR